MALRIVTWFLLLLFTGLFQGQAWARVCNGGLEGGYWQSSPGFSARHFNADSYGSMRVRREVTSTSTNDYRYIYDGRAILQERDAKNLPTWTVSRGPTGLLALSRHRRSYADHAYYYTDAHGNVAALVNAYQNVAARYLYDPYGNQVAISGPWADANPFRFSSQYYHAPSGLHAYACRFYDPGLQRWLTPDPLRDMGGVNPYQFNYGNPVTYADPDGRTPLLTGAIGAGIGAIVGGGVAWWQGGSSSDIMNAALRGGLAGGVAGLTMGFGAPALSGIFGNGIVAGAINGLVSGAVSDAVNQGYDLVQGTRCEFSFSELGAGAAMGGIFGGGFSAASSALGGMRSAMAARGGANAAKTAVPNGSAYSVAFETRLNPASYPGLSRAAHFQEANGALLRATEGDAQFAQIMQQGGVNLQRTATGLAPRTSPAGWTWHHAPEPGVMQLVPRTQHAPGSIFQNTIHPGGQGGYSIWGQ